MRPRFDPCVRKIPWRREWQPTPLFLPGQFHGQRSLVGYSAWGRKVLDMTEWLNTFTLSYIIGRCLNFVLLKIYSQDRMLGACRNILYSFEMCSQWKGGEGTKGYQSTQSLTSLLVLRMTLFYRLLLIVFSYLIRCQNLTSFTIWSTREAHIPVPCATSWPRAISWMDWTVSSSFSMSVELGKKNTEGEPCFLMDSHNASLTWLGWP